MGLSHLDRKPLDTPSSESSTAFNQENGKLTLSRHSVCYYCTQPDTISAPVMWEKEKREHSQIDERMARGCMMRACARLADSICPIRPRADDLLHPCRSRNRPTDHLPCPEAAGGSHTLANPRAAQREHTVNRLGIGCIGLRTRCGRKNAGPNEVCSPSTAACTQANSESAYTQATHR